MKKIIIIACCLLLVSLETGFAQTELEVVHWWVSEGEANALSELRDAYVETTGNIWKDVSIPGGTANTMIPVLQSMIAVGKEPEAIQVLMGPNLWRLAEAGLLTDISEVAEQGEWHLFLPDVIKERVQYQGKYIAAPIGAHRVNSLWSNADIFRQLELEVPSTWDEFFHAAEIIKSAGYVPVSNGVTPYILGIIFEQIVLSSHGVDFYRKSMMDLDREALQDPRMIESLQRLKQLKAYFDQESLGREWDVSVQMVMNGQAAMVFMGDWANGEFLSAGLEPEKDYFCTATPGSEDFFLVDVDTFAIFASTDPDVKKAQQDFAEIIVTPSVQKKFNIKKGGLPPRTGISCEGFNYCACQSIEDFSEAASQNTVVPSFAGYEVADPEITESVTELLHVFFTSEMSPEEAAQKLDAVIFSAM